MTVISVSQGLKDGRNVDGEKELVRYLVWETKYWNENLRKVFVANMKASWKIFCEVNPHIVKTMSVMRIHKKLWKRKNDGIHKKFLPRIVPYKNVTIIIDCSALW
ncbi:MAG: hypothetical protein LBU65_01270 [Planctomycetaceae bacterium]|nr:hypothetical protein [Planctomycetaceae bacterium]